MEIRKAIVKVFIREIILYNDKIVITYNFCDTFNKHKITQPDIKAIEKQSETAAFSYPLGSNKLSSPAPRKKPAFQRAFCVARKMPTGIAARQKRCTRITSSAMQRTQVGQSARALLNITHLNYLINLY